MSVNKFGLIGYPLGHSLSPYIHERIMDAIGVRGRYDLYEMEPADLSIRLPSLLKELTGFNCTIPYKMDIIPYLTDLDQTASSCQAVNTVYQGRGYNTDVTGFLSMNLQLRDKEVLILGAGGVAHMMGRVAVEQGAMGIWIYARNQEQARRFADEIRIWIRSPEAFIPPEDRLQTTPDEVIFEGTEPRINVISQADLEHAGGMDVILNGTPLGMWPYCSGLPATVDIFRKDQQVFDTIYNPAATRWILQARKRGAKAKGGLPMLFGQAVAAQKIWHPQGNFSKARLAPILSDLSKELLHKFPVKYIFTGFMGAGKTTISKEVGRRLKIPVYDLDQQIQKRYGCTIPEIFARDGESGFRAAEYRVLEELLSQEGSAFIATGGGAIMQESVRQCIRSHDALLIYLHASLDCLWTRVKHSEDRPLLGDTGLTEQERLSQVTRLYEMRLPTYEDYCDIKINGEGERNQVIDQVISALGYKDQTDMEEYL